jgi:alkyl hydroperoxide reductase subunit AhpC
VATLLLTARHIPDAPPAECAGGPLPLRAWLGSDWAILFSHPGDFVRCELEMDRWLAVVQRAFAGGRIKPLALEGGQPCSAHSWVTQVSGDASLVLLVEPAPGNLPELDRRARALHERIGVLRTQRFVMVIDSGLALRRTFTYGSLADVPSPLELLGWANVTRTRHARDEGDEDTAPRDPAHRSAHRTPAAAACQHTTQGHGTA